MKYKRQKKGSKSNSHYENSTRDSDEEVECIFC